MNDDLDFLNKEQENAIELQIKKPHLKELAELNFKLGRLNQSKRILQEIKEEEQEREIKIREQELKNKEEEQDRYEQELKDKENMIYSLRMEVLSFLAQKKRGEATEKIVEYIKKNNCIYTIRDDNKSEIWRYDEGVYKPNGKTYISEECRKILEENFTNHLNNEVIAKIETDTFIDADKFFENKYLEEIPVQNGILNIKTKKLSKFNSKKIFFNKLPIVYDPDKKCPFIEKHFSDVLKNPEDSKVMFELFGFLLYKDYFIEKAVMFVGDGRNGKGKTIDLMKRFLGGENCSSVPLNQLSEGGFRIWDLFGKMANLAGDLASNDLKDTASLKQTTGRDLIGADRKNKTTVNFVNYAKHVFACNELPRVYDFSRGFWERWILFEFPYTFIKEEDYNKLNDYERKNYKIKDPFIIDKISSPEEMSGLLNKALDGLNNILKQKEFSYSKGVEEIKMFWIRKSDSFTSFAIDHLQESYEDYLPKQKLRKAFMKYCKKHQIKGASDKNIKVVLEEMFGVTDRQISEGIRIWEGVKFKQNSEYNFMEGSLK